MGAFGVWHSPEQWVDNFCSCCFTRRLGFLGLLCWISFLAWCVNFSSSFLSKRDWRRSLLKMLNQQSGQPFASLLALLVRLLKCRYWRLFLSRSVTWLNSFVYLSRSLSVILISSCAELPLLKSVRHLLSPKSELIQGHSYPDSLARIQFYSVNIKV